MKYIIQFTLFACFITGCNSNSGDNTKTDITKFVNTFIGTEGYGKTFPGAALPFSMLQVSPDNGWSQGYDYAKEQMVGLSHFHISGRPDIQFSNLLVMPTIKKVVNDTTGKGRNFIQSFLSPYLHANEQTNPGYYAVNLIQEGIFAEVALRKRTALHGYHFAKSDTAAILLDLGWSHNQSTNKDCYMFVEDDSSTVVGYRSVEGNLSDKKIYFAAKFSTKINRFNLVENGEIRSSSKEANKQHVSGVFYFANEKKNPILIKVAFSSINEENALENVNTEMDTWDLGKVKNEASEKWNEILGKVEIKTNNIQVITNFYSALYRSFLAPNLMSDISNEFRNAVGEVEKGTQPQFHNISFEKGFNTVFPLLNLLDPQQTEATIQSALVYQASNNNSSLPGFLHWSKDIDRSAILYSAPTISAAWLKGIDSYNGLQVLKSFENYESATNLSNQTIEQSENSLKKRLQNTYNAWSVTQLAKNFNDSTLSENYLQNSTGYKKLFDKKSGLFVHNINEADSDSLSISPPIYAEQFQVVHAIDTLIKFMGDANAFETKLDTLFKPIFNKDLTSTFFKKINQPENEFFFHAAYLYNHINKPEKTQKLIRILLENYFKPTPDGLPVQDATGCISAWYVFSALGFLPVNPVSGMYEIGSPIIRQANIQLPNDNDLIIKVINQSPQNVYVQSVSFNNERIDNFKIAHERLMEGGELVFEMTNRKQLATRR